MEIVKNPLVSIIIPVYNTKPYLERCIQSIVHQTHKNLEILLIDDGSTDGSSGLCDRFEEQYANIHVVHLENSGVSAARNRGLDIAQGEFILFIDSDDAVSNSYVESFVKSSNGIDIVIGSIEDIYVDKYGKIYHQNLRKHKALLEGNLFEEYCNLIDWIRGPVAKLYRKHIIDKYKLKFNESLCVAEDQIFNFEYYSYIQSYRLQKKSIYKYYHHDTKISLSNLLTDKAFFDDVFKLNLEYNFLRVHCASNFNSIYIYQLIGLLNKYTQLKYNSSMMSSYKRVKILARLNPLIVEQGLTGKKKIIIYLLLFKLYGVVTIYYWLKSKYLV